METCLKESYYLRRYVRYQVQYCILLRLYRLQQYGTVKYSQTQQIIISFYERLAISFIV